MQIAVTCVCVCVRCAYTCAHICLCMCVWVCPCARPGTTLITSERVCVCMGCTYKSSRFGPRSDDKAIKLYVSHINCFDLFFLSDSWLDGNKGHFTQLERVLKSAKHEEMASEEINSGKCLSSTGSKRTTLFPCVYALPIFQEDIWKSLHVDFNTVFWEKIKLVYRLHDCGQQNVPLYFKLLLLPSRQVSSVHSFATELPTYVAFAIIPLKPIKQSSHFVLEPMVVTLLTTFIHFNSWWPHK